MAYEWRALTEKEYLDLADYGQRIVELTIVERPKIQTERATAEISWNTRIANINKDIASNDAAIAAIRSGTADGKTFVFRPVTDVEAKTIADYQQKNASLKAEIVKIQVEMNAAESGWRNRYANIDTQIHDLTDAIANIRTPIEV